MSMSDGLSKVLSDQQSVIGKMSKLLVVVGATGQQGGSVIEAFLKRQDYRLRGLTRDVHSSKAVELAKKGVQMVAADLDDEASLVQALEVSHSS
jgi:uncharacterized protein YbjT (DUF2867 family)